MINSVDRYLVLVGHDRIMSHGRVTRIGPASNLRFSCTFTLSSSYHRFACTVFLLIFHLPIFFSCCAAGNGIKMGVIPYLFYGSQQRHHSWCLMCPWATHSLPTWLWRFICWLPFSGYDALLRKGFTMGFTNANNAQAALAMTPLNSRVNEVAGWLFGPSSSFAIAQSRLKNVGKIPSSFTNDSMLSWRRPQAVNFATS